MVAADSRPRALSAAELAWIAVLPCALLAAVAIALLGPPLGDALTARGSDALWPPGWWEAEGHPEPAKQGRYVLAALAPLALALAVAIVARRPRSPVLRPAVVRAIAFATYAALLALVVVALLEQETLIQPGAPAPALFGVGTVVVAALMALSAPLVLSRRGAAAGAARLARETPVRRRVCLAAAGTFVALWLLKAITTDRLVADAGGLNLPWTLNDAIAVLDGRTPLVDLHVIYAKLLPYATAPVLGVFGTTTLVYTTFMAVLNALALLAVYAVFRLLTRSSPLALALLVAFVAVSDLGGVAIAGGVVSPLTLSAMWPMRYGGAFLLAWLVARHLDGRAPGRPWVLFLVGGLVAINTLEFGTAAVLATLAALLCARPPRSRAEATRLAAHAVAGLAAAVAAVALLTLVRAGELPSARLLLEWPRIFSTLGWFSLPLPLLGLHLALYATFAAAVLVAAVRVSRSAQDTLLTGMLAWSGIFGLFVGSYFIGRPDVLKLAGMLAAWFFALAPLAVVCGRALAARQWHRPALPELLVLFGLALALCSLRDAPLPHQEIARLSESRPEPPYQMTAERFVRERTQPGEAVAILLPMSYRIAHDVGVRNVSPFGFMNAVVTRRQMAELLDVLRREDVRSVFLPVPPSRLLDEGDAAPEQIALLGELGWVPRSAEGRLLELRRS